VDGVQLEPRDYGRLLKASYKKTFNRDRPLSQFVTNAVTGGITNAVAAILRNETRKGAETQISRAVKPAAKDTNGVVALDARAATRPATLPALDSDYAVLLQMETELFGHVTVTPADLLELKQSRAQSVQRALLKTEKVTAERLFILAPLPADASLKGQSRVNLSLN
jgi:hypothetical protein